MIRGTTPTHTFNLPFDVSAIAELRIIYAQAGETKLVKKMADCTLVGNMIKVKLTQKETLMFDPSQLAEIQMRVLTAAGDALASAPKRVGVGRLLEDEVME